MLWSNGWRKPKTDRSSTKEVSELMMSKQIHYLECHDSNDGIKTFNAGTRYDFYLLENTPIYKNTIINGEDRIDVEVDLRDYDFIPNYNFDLFKKIMVSDSDVKCPIIYNRSNYGSDNKKWVSNEKSNIFKYVLIHTTPKSGVRYMYSSRNDNGHFGIPKVIFGDSGIFNAIIDMDGIYGMTGHSMAIKVDNEKEAVNIKMAIESEEFNIFLKSVSYSNFMIEWRIFLHMKKDFWKYFI
jgi:hypothetical protein